MPSYYSVELLNYMYDESIIAIDKLSNWMANSTYNNLLHINSPILSSYESKESLIFKLYEEYKKELQNDI